jgi:transcriptional regulator with XRE-family HTH domain
MKWTDRVRAGLRNKGYTFQDLADRIGVTRPAVSMYLTGKREPTLQQVKEIAKMVDLSVSELLGDDATFIADKQQIRAAELIKEVPQELQEQALKVLETFTKPAK